MPSDENENAPCLLLARRQNRLLPLTPPVPVPSYHEFYRRSLSFAAYPGMSDVEELGCPLKRFSFHEVVSFTTFLQKAGFLSRKGLKMDDSENILKLLLEVSHSFL